MLVPTPERAAAPLAVAQIMGFRAVLFCGITAVSHAAIGSLKAS